MNATKFESIGVYMPENIVTTNEIVSKMKNPPEFDVEEITGIQSRRVRGKDENSLSLAVKAAQECLKKSQYDTGDIDLVISSCIGRFVGNSGEYKFYFEPSLSHMIKKELGMVNANNFDVSNACAGLFSGIFILDSMIKSGSIKRGMVVSGECATPIADTAIEEVTDSFDPQFGSLTVGDSGAAVIIDKAIDDQDYIEYFEMMTCAEYSNLCIGMPSDQRGNIALYTNNPQMHKEDRVKMWPTFQKKVMSEMGKNFADENYDYIIQHQVGKKAIRNFNKVGEKYFDTPMPETLSCVDRFGNTATTSHMVVLYHHLREGNFKKGSKVLMVPAASGLVTGFMSAKITNLEV